MKKLLSTTVAFAACMAACGIAYAAVTFDPAAGTGFVGKGDVQLALGWNNKQLQANAGDLSFRVSTVVDTTWVCTKDGATNTQGRLRSTTTNGVISAVARERSQITGFTLSGYSGTPAVAIDGPAVGSCPNGWTAGALQVHDPVSTLEVSAGSETYTPLL